MDEKDNILKQIYDGIRSLAQTIFPHIQDRSVSLQKLYEQVFSSARNTSDSSGNWMWLVDLYMEPTGGNIFAIFAKEGLIYKASVTVQESGVSIGDLVQVKEVFEPVAQSRFRIQRQADGTDRWFLLASSAVLNRNGQIDSTSFFDNGIKRAEESKQYPFLTFCHLGEKFKMGMTDFLARSDFILLASGVYDDGLVAQLMKKAYKAEPDYWGSSISFFPIEGSMLPISEGVEVPMYTDGEFYEISILPEKIACALFTAMKSRKIMERAMNQELKDALKKLAGGDEALTADLIALADGANDEIVQKRLIARAAEGVTTPTNPPVTEISAPVVPPVEPAKTEPAKTEPEKPAVQDIEVTEEFMSEIVDRIVAHPSFAKLIEPVTQAIAEIQVGVSDFAQQLTEMRAAYQSASGKIEERFVGLEKTEEEKKKQWLNDLPRNASPHTVIRPRIVRSGTEGAEKKSAKEIAEETLANIKN